MRLLRAMLLRDLRLAFRRWGDVVSPLMFFAIVTSLFPLALSPRHDVLQSLGPGVLWIAALLAMLLSLNALFRQDIEDGSMEQLAIGPHPLALLMLYKSLGHWLVAGLPLVALAPLLAVTYYLPGDAVAALCLTLLIGTPTLSLLGSVGAALTAGIRQSSGLLALLVLPLCLPVLMFGSRATALAGQGEDISGPLLLLAAMLALAASLLPLAAAAGIRISLD
ncbi:MAG: heme exporter protein CcmB [Gammaproteobacteria bacterium]|nr:MAG: heme exporter protein CcmB [Gammaproteobacteria bacterium]